MDLEDGPSSLVAPRSCPPLEGRSNFCSIVCRCSDFARTFRRLVWKPFFTSDDAVLNRLAESIYEQRSLFPRGWITNNGDLMVPSGAVLIAPMLKWVANSYTLHAVAGIAAIVSVLASMMLFLRVARLPAALILTLGAVLGSGLSWISAIFLYLQTTYAWWPAVFFVCAALVLKHRMPESKSERGKLTVIAMFTVLFSFSLANPSRAMLMFVIPLYVFDRFLSWQLSPSPSASQNGTIRGALKALGFYDSLTLVGIFTAFVFALAVYKTLFITGIVATVHNASDLRRDGIAGVRRHAQMFVQGWFEYLGAVREANAGDGTLERVLQPIRWIFAVWLSWIGVSELVRVLKPGHPVRRALAASFAASLFPILFLYLAFAPLASGMPSIRLFHGPYRHSSRACVILVVRGIGVFQESGLRGHDCYCVAHDSNCCAALCSSFGK
jgi:hypothetical protein